MNLYRHSSIVQYCSNLTPGGNSTNSSQRNKFNWNFYCWTGNKWASVWVLISVGYLLLESTDATSIHCQILRWMLSLYPITPPTYSIRKLQWQFQNTCTPRSRNNHSDHSELSSDWNPLLVTKSAHQRRVNRKI